MISIFAVLSVFVLLLVVSVIFSVCVGHKRSRECVAALFCAVFDVRLSCVWTEQPSGQAWSDGGVSGAVGARVNL